MKMITQMLEHVGTIIVLHNIFAAICRTIDVWIHKDRFATNNSRFWRLRD